MVLLDAINEAEVASVPVGAAFRKRFNNPYAVIHRADVHKSLLEGVEATERIELCTSTRVERVQQDQQNIIAIDAAGRSHEGVALIGCDGVKSAVRQQYVGDPVRVSGHVCIAPSSRRTSFRPTCAGTRPRSGAGRTAIGPLSAARRRPVQRGGDLPQQQAGNLESVTEGSREEVLSYFDGISARPRQLLHLPRAGSAGPPPIANRSNAGPSAG